MERFVMRRTLIAAAALSAATVASSAFAGFTFSATQQPDVAGYSVFLIRAINDGVGSGTELDGYDLTFTMNAGTTAHFNVLDSDFDGTPDTADLVNTGNGNAGFLRVGAFGTTSIVSTTPALGPTQPNPWDAINSWSIAAISTGSENATGTGAVIARLFQTGGQDAGGSFTGQIGGSEGSAIPVTFSWGAGGPGPNDAPEVTVNPNAVTIDIASQTSFGPVAVTATDDSAVASLVAGTVPAQIADNITITGATTGPLSVSGTGFTAADVGTYMIDFTATDDGNPALTDVGTFTLTINNTIPEPATLSLLAGLGLLGLRRRK